MARVCPSISHCRPDAGRMHVKAMRIAIVGAGPAGCHLAYRLADAGHDVLLFDPRVPGYEKPCGGGLSPLVGQHFPEVMALPFARHCPPRLILRASDGSQIEQPLKPSTWAIVSRADFGRALFQRAMAEAHFRQRGGGLYCRLSYHAGDEPQVDHHLSDTTEPDNSQQALSPAAISPQVTGLQPGAEKE